MANIVVCCDGTWDNKDAPQEGASSNVALLFDAIAEADELGTLQNKQYFSGIGATGSWLERCFDGATGDGIQDKIEEAYRYLSTEYREGDRIFLFGFSRGAYTVRSLAGFLRNVGLLPAPVPGGTWDQDFQALYDFYRDRQEDSAPDSTQALDIMAQHGCRIVNAYFIGVWDTVGALGVPHLLSISNEITRLLNGNIDFHDLRLSTKVRYAYHALAIDERRKDFAPTLWAQQPLEAGNLQDMEQSWFAGVHTSVGGGQTDSRLSSVTLNWMATRAQGAGLGLKIPALPIDYLLGEFVDSYSGVYWLSPPFPRPICAGHIPADPTFPAANQPLLPTLETINQSVADRLALHPPLIPVKWNPLNLEDRLQRLPPPLYTP